MKPWKWIKEHPAEAAAIAAGLALTGGAAAGAFGAAGTAAAASGAVAADAAAIAAAEAAAAGTAGASAAVGADAAAIAAANAAAAGGGEAVSGAALGHLAGSGVGVETAAPFVESSLLSGLPMTEYGLGGAGEASSMLAPYAAPSAFPAPSSIAGAGAESSLYGPNVGTDPSAALDSRTWWDRFGEKFKDPKTTMRLGMMAAQMGAPRQQGGPAGGYEAPQMRSAMHSQEDITKKWLMLNDPNTYRRIYGNPQGVA